MPLAVLHMHHVLTISEVHTVFSSNISMSPTESYVGIATHNLVGEGTVICHEVRRKKRCFCLYLTLRGNMYIP